MTDTVLIKRASIFGSYARDEQKADSDLGIELELDLKNELPDIIYVIWDEIEASLAAGIIWTICL